MTPDVRVTRAGREARPVLDRLGQLYLHDLSETGGWDVGPDGTFASSLFDRCWTEAWRTPFLITADDSSAGFAIVARGSTITGREDVWDLAEFFVLRRWRRLGVGRASAHRLLREFPGEWEVRPFLGSEPAERFWRTICAEVATSPVEVGRYQRSDGRKRSVLRFAVG